MTAIHRCLFLATLVASLVLPRPVPAAAADRSPAAAPPVDATMEPETVAAKQLADQATNDRQPSAGPQPGVAAEGAATAGPANEARIDAMAARIDALLAEAWAERGIVPAPAASDARFLRRVSLDLIGRIPRVAEAREFLADTSPDRRRHLVERLLASREHADAMAARWHDALLPDVVGSTALEPWLAEKFAAGVAYDRIAHDIIAAGGKPDGGGAMRPFGSLEQPADRKPTELAAAVSRTFLGTQIQCAECHKHPTDDWTQDDFWGFAAFFGPVKHPKTEAVVSPRFLGDAAAVDPDRDARGQLAAWTAAPSNRWFARAAVNRLWGLLFGVGIVDPVDDLGDHNPPAHAGILDELARFFATGGWNHRDVLRAVTRTRAYGLANGDGRLFAAMPLEPLTAGQLANSLATAYHAARLDAGGQGFPRRAPAAEQFLAKFRTAPGQGREYTAGIPQAIALMNGQLFDPMRAVYHESVITAKDDPGRIEALFLATVSRPPAAAELATCLEALGRETTTAGRRLALVDIHWALVNSAEFAFSP